MTWCSTASRERGEPLAATASTGPAFLLVEDAGPWGPHVLHSRRLPSEALAAVRRWQRELGVRPLLVRRPGRAVHRRTVFVANAQYGWLESTELADLRELAHLDLSGVRSAAGVGLRAWRDPVVLVCTHGRHDPCCATRGRPVAEALARSHPDLTWESSHLGGDRFAGNLAILPRGDFFGRVEPADAPALVDAYLAGRLDLDHHRGRCTQAWDVQAAVAQVRNEHGLSGLDDVVARRRVAREGLTRVELVAGGRVIVARVATTAAPAARLTCHADADEASPRYTVTLEG